MSDSVQDDCEKAVLNWHVRQELIDGLRGMSIFRPNAIQVDAIPLALSGRDVMVCAQTGSGKTLMFLLPILQRLSENLEHTSCQGTGGCPVEPNAMVIVPTLELALQVASVAEELVRFLPNPPAINVLTKAAEDEEEASRSFKRHLVVSTLDHLLRCISEGACRMDRLQMVSIDEADAVLSSCKETSSKADHVLGIIEELQSAPQFLLTMAHLTDAREEELVRRFPSIQRVSHTGVLVPTLRQCFHYLPEWGDKDGKLLTVLRTAGNDPWLSEGTSLVFCSSAQSGDRLAKFLAESSPSYTAVVLHEEIPYEERILAARRFREGDVGVLISTDACARGLDFPRLRHVIMYDVPTDVTAFVHCAGRTARRGQSGLVTCLVQAPQQYDFTCHHGLQPAAQLFHIN